LYGRIIAANASVESQEELKRYEFQQFAPRRFSTVESQEELKREIPAEGVSDIDGERGRISRRVETPLKC
jgi:hypothetical protein